jgi:ParB-like chromosome segregation protein Spo0J
MTITAAPAAPHLPDAIEHLPTDALVPYARNSRTHSPEQVAQIAASIREFGFTNPVLIDANNTLIAGHGRVMAAQQLGLASVPAIRLAHLSDAQRRAYVIADNQLALNAGWDMSALARELEDLSGEGFDIDLLGFGADELTALLGEYGQDAAKPGDGLTDPDDAPAVQQKPATKLGDVWLMGKHRLMCGDSTSAQAVNNLALGGGY